MKKGELRKEAILKTAEKLFFERGYEETSIQDILDTLSISKGGFYHYFESKGALLEEICRQRSMREIERVRMELFSGKFNPTQKLNIILNATQLFNREDPAFMALLLKLSYIESDVKLREQTRSFLLENLRPMLDEVIREGRASGAFFTRHPGQIARVLLMLGADINDEVCRMLSAEPQNPDVVIAIMDLLETCRDSVESLCGAKFGSVQIFDVEHLLEAFRQTVGQMNAQKESFR